MVLGGSKSQWFCGVKRSQVFCGVRVANGVVERGPRVVNDFSWCARCLMPHAVVSNKASATMARLILESPYSRSMKVIGTSTTR